MLVSDVLQLRGCAGELGRPSPEHRDWVSAEVLDAGLPQFGKRGVAFALLVMKASRLRCRLASRFAIAVSVPRSAVSAVTRPVFRRGR